MSIIIKYYKVQDMTTKATESSWQLLIDSLDRFSSDFMAAREQPLQQEREDLFEGDTLPPLNGSPPARG